MDFDIREIRATRNFHFLDERKDKRTVSVFIGKPEQSPDSNQYWCSFQIIGIGSQETQLAQGQDSIQALQLAMDLIAANINDLNDEIGGRLEWNGDATGNLGFT